MKMQQRVVLLQTMGKPVYYLILAFSLVVFWRGHNEPGGGFIGGLLAVSATLLLANTHGVAEARKRLPLGSHVRLAAAGVLCAAVSGVAGLLVGNSFMHHIWWDVPLPGGSTLALSTVQLFDLGVYLCVWGGIGGYASELLSIGDEASRQIDLPAAPDSSAPADYERFQSDDAQAEASAASAAPVSATAAAPVTASTQERPA